MARVQVSTIAARDLVELIESHGLPKDAPARVRRSLGRLASFPRIGRPLDGRWEGAHLVLGPWTWMLIVYDYDSDLDVVSILRIQDARASTAATAG